MAKATGRGPPGIEGLQAPPLVQRALTLGVQTLALPLDWLLHKHA